jgi:tyrosine-protein phosphatase YwqE
MFEFFSKRKFLVDYLENFVDVHNHILPGIDDGAKSPEESIALIRGFGEFGVTNFVATPHIMNSIYPNTPETINASLDKLRDTLLDNGLREVSVDAAAEHMIDDIFEAMLEKGEVMPLRKEHILVEMSFLQAPINFDQAIGKITSKWLFPVLAHPERYKFLHQRMNKYARFREQGILLQMNLLSLGDYYDKDVQKMALKLLDEGLISFVASDVHRLQHLEVLKETTLPDKVINQLIPVIHNTIETFY